MIGGLPENTAKTLISGRSDILLKWAPKITVFCLMLLQAGADKTKWNLPGKQRARTKSAIQRFGADTRKETFFCFFSGMNAESILKNIFEKGEKNNERKN